jgi:outer membrane lipoprotein SlyB
MIRKILNILLALSLASTLAGCGRDLSTNTYTSDSTLNIVLKGKVVAKRDVTIKETEKLGDNTTGALAGGATGGLVAANSSNNTAVIAGSAIVGGITGALVESALSTSKGVEYIVDIDRSDLQDNYYEGNRMIGNTLAAVRATGTITVVQAKGGKNEPVISEGQAVRVIVSEKRTRIIPAN